MELANLRLQVGSSPFSATPSFLGHLGRTLLSKCTDCPASNSISLGVFSFLTIACQTEVRIFSPKKLKCQLFFEKRELWVPVTVHTAAIHESQGAASHVQGTFSVSATVLMQLNSILLRYSSLQLALPKPQGKSPGSICPRRYFQAGNALQMQGGEATFCHSALRFLLLYLLNQKACWE